MSEITKTVLRACIGISLAALFISKIIKDSGINIVSELMKGTLSLVVIAFALYGVCVFIATLRWKLLLGVQGIVVSFYKLYQLSMIGTFFSLVIPGAVSGDLIKMFYIGSHAKGRNAEAILTIFLDRIIGLVGLFIVAVVSIGLSLDYLRIAGREIQLCAVTIVICTICLFVLLIGIYFRSQIQRITFIEWILSTIAKKLPEKVLDIVNRLTVALDSYKGNEKVILNSVILSMSIHIIIAMVLILIGRCFHENLVQWYNYFLATQTANAVGAIPITPMGIGSRDLVISIFLKDAGADVEKAAVIPTMFTIILSVWSLIGGLFYIFNRRQISNLKSAQA